MKPFTVINGQRDERTVVCTWCASKFLDKHALRVHWDNSPQCGRNKTVNNQLQTKYGAADIIVAQPGEETLNLVRAATCSHEVTEKGKDADGNVVWRQCTNCYTRFAP